MELNFNKKNIPIYQVFKNLVGLVKENTEKYMLNEIPENNRGFLALIGGAEEKHGAMKVLRKVLEVTKAQKIVVIPTASSYNYELGREYKHVFKVLGISNVASLYIRYREDVDSPQNLEVVQGADMIFFTGGDQVKLVDILVNTKLIELIKYRFENEKLSIAGTSAGAAATSNPLIYNGDDIAYHKGTVKYHEGFGVLTDVTVDTHFIERSRIGRLVQFLASGQSQRGLGVSEDTAVIIYPNLRAEVVGSSSAVFVSADKLRQTNFHQIQEQEIISAHNLKFSFLVDGDLFDFNTWHSFTDKEALTSLE